MLANLDADTRVEHGAILISGFKLKAIVQTPEEAIRGREYNLATKRNRATTSICFVVRLAHH